MSPEGVAVATAVVSAAVGVGGLLLTWHRGSAKKRPRLARALGTLTLVSAVGVIVAVATSGDEEVGAKVARGSLSAGEYRAKLIGICQGHVRDAQRIGEAEGNRPVYGQVLQLESKTTGLLKQLRPPRSLAADHRMAVTLWDRRVSLLDYYYVDHRDRLDDPEFAREFDRALAKVVELSQALQKRFVRLGVTPECNLFVG